MTCHAACGETIQLPHLLWTSKKYSVDLAHKWRLSQAVLDFSTSVGEQGEEGRVSWQSEEGMFGENREVFSSKISWMLLEAW